MNAEPTTHPTAEELAAFSLGKLTEADTLAMARHLETCPDCRGAAGKVAPDTFVGLIQAARVALPAATPAPAVLPSRLGTSPSMLAEAVPQADVDLKLPPELANHQRLRILRVLGQGGMGTVYLAEHRLMKKLLAVKVISKSLLDHPEALPRFHREVQTAAQLDHPNIVRAHDAEQAGDLHMLVMEYVEGLDLSKVLERKGPLPIAHSCHYIRQAALGLQHAFDKKMVHRDIKPQNLMLIPHKGIVKILDFGLARLASERHHGKGLTAQNAVMGTPEYMAPEQATDARTADIRADIYSLGCTLYTLLTGRTPFQEETAVKMILAHLDQEPTPLHELRPEVSRELSAVVGRMMAKEPGQRYQTPKEVADALVPFCKPGEKAKVPGSETRKMVALTETPPVVPVAIPAVLAVSASQADDPAAVFAGLAASNEVVAASRQAGTKAPPRSPLLPWWRQAAGGAAAVALIALGIVLWISTNYGKIRIEIWPEAAEAQVEVKVDGEVVHITSPEHYFELRAREHGLHVTGRDFENHTEKFTVKRGAKDVLHVNLVRKKGTVKIQLSPLPEGVQVKDVQVKIDGKPVDISKPIELEVGEHRLLVTSSYCQPVSKSFSVQASSNPDLVIPFERGPEPGLVATFFEGCDLDWKKKTAIHEQINFDWGDGSPDRDVPEKDLFSVRWEGFIKAPKPGWYRLITESDDGIRVWLDSRLIIDRWDLHRPKPHSTEAELTGAPPAEVEFTGALQPLRVEYFEQAGKAAVRLRWEKLGDGLPPQLVPKEALFHTQEVLKKAQESQRVLTAQVTRDKRPGGSVHSLAFSPKGDMLVSGHSDNKVRLWDVQTGKELHCFEGHTAPLRTVAFSSDGRYILSAGHDKVIRLWDVTSRKLIRELKGHTGLVTCVAFSPVNGCIALSASSWLKEGEKVLADDNTVRVWDVERGVELACIRDFTQPVLSVAFFSDGRRFVCGGLELGIRLYDISDTRKPIRTFSSYAGRAIVSRDGQRLLTSPPFSGPSDHIQLWTVNTGNEPVRTFHKHRSHLESMAFSPDGRYVVSGSWDFEVRLWELETGRELCRFRPQHDGWVSAVAFSPDGRIVASGSTNGTLRLWALPTELCAYHKNLEEALKEPEKVFALDLSNQKLGKLPREIGRFGNLQELNASNNRLGTIPDEVGWLKQLRTLNVSGNQLTSLPNELGWLSGLRALDVSNNRLTVLNGHPFTGKGELHTLNVSGNQLSSLPNELGWLRSLRSLDVSNNRLTVLNGHPFAFTGELLTLNVSGNQLKSLPEEIGWLSKLREFNVSGNQLATLTGKVGQLGGLERFDLSGNPLPRQEVEKARKLLPKARIVFEPEK